MAFLSLEWQVIGLFGAQGLRPTAMWLEQVRAQLGGSAWLQLPTLFWLGASDRALEWTCIAGVAVSVVVVLGLIPRLGLIAAWLLYLSLTNAGEPFLSYQWDALLLETGFLAIFWAPDTWRLGSPAARSPSLLILWLLRWLLFRLMFFSGWVKLQSGDPAWWNLTALEWHYETQPLPAWTSWYMDQLPTWFQMISCAGMMVVELGLPFLIILGRRARLIAFAGFVGLQAFIAATGNYGFFNLLSVVLCIPLLDDRQLFAVDRRRRIWTETRDARREGQVKRIVNAFAAALVLLLSIPSAVSQLTGVAGPWLHAANLVSFARPFQVVGRYGLFAVMTKTRPEVLIEGSDDGETWKPYVFRWKPGPLDRAPAFVEPDMPRLDWQMWFDGLYIERMLQSGTRGFDLVTPDLMRRLQEGSPVVLALLESNPFPDHPPRQLRWSLYNYRFTDAAEREQTGNWWKRELIHAEEPPAR